MNPKPHPGVIRIPCSLCKGPRDHFGIGRCWECMTPDERERFRHE